MCCYVLCNIGVVDAAAAAANYAAIVEWTEKVLKLIRFGGSYVRAREAHKSYYALINFQW